MTVMPAWGWLLSVLLVAVPVLDGVTGGVTLTTPAGLVLVAVRTALEGGLMLWMAGRVGLGRRSRLALVVPGAMCLVGAAEQVLFALGLGTGRFAMPASVDGAVTWLSYLSTVALLWLPMAPLGRSEWATYTIDSVVSVGGLGALSWVLVTRPLQQALTPASSSPLLIYGVSLITHVAVLNALAWRGLGVPSRRAIWALVIAETTYLPVLLLAQYWEAGVLHSTVAINAFYFGGEIPRVLAALWFRHDEIDAHRPPERLLARFSNVNPFLLLTPLLVGVALLVAVLHGPAAHVRPLAVILVAGVALLVGRLLLSTVERARLLAAEAETAARLQHAKHVAVGRLAGGVAHEFNNLMQIVIGHADLATMDAGPWSPIQRDLSSIRDAADRAAALTGQLLHFAGRQPALRRPIDLAATIRQLETVRGALGPDVPLELALSPVPLTLADADQIQQLVVELATNARAAMPDGGRFRIEVREDVLTEALPDAVLRVPPGRYVVIDASDTGAGIPPADVPHVFEPFFTTRPAEQGTGLGLAAVYGIVASHQGGIGLESTPGLGTRFRLYFPVVGAPTPA